MSQEIYDAASRAAKAARDTATAQGAALLDIHDVCAKTCLSAGSIWKYVRLGGFPTPRMVGRNRRWLSTEIEAWMAALPEYLPAEVQPPANKQSGVRAKGARR
jgi:predicted DNA-binding transcriptional regulator AlpA